MLKNKKLTVVLLAILAVVAVAAVILSFLNKADKKASNDVEVYQLAEQDMSTYLTVKGKVESQAVEVVTTDISAKVKSVKVENGDEVKKGDTLIILDDSDIQDQIDALEAQAKKAESSSDKEAAQKELEEAVEARETGLTKYQAAVDSAQSAVNSAVENFNVDSAAGEDGSVLDADAAVIEQAKSQLASAQSEYNAQKETLDAAVDAAQNKVDSAANSTTAYDKQISELKSQLSETTITAPADGIVTDLKVKKGSTASGTLLKIQDTSDLQVNAILSSSNFSDVSRTMEVEITSDDLGEDEVIKGKVSKVVNNASSSDEEDSEEEDTFDEPYYAVIHLTEKSKDLEPGMTVEVKIKIEDGGKALAVESDAIGEADGANYVMRAVHESGDDYKIEKIPVTIGEQTDDYTEIDSSSLNEGDFILTNPHGAEVDNIVTIYVVNKDK